MTDNYQIDKNSKLFQKFLNLKNNKQTEPLPEKQPQQDIPHPVKNGGSAGRQTYHIPVAHANRDKNGEKTTLHVTIGDIEEAASMSFQQEEYATRRTNQKPVPTEKQQINHEIPKEQELPIRAQFQMTMKEEYSSNKPLEFSKPERPRQRRARDFNDKNRGRNQKSFRLNESTLETSSVIKTNPSEVFVRQDQSKKQKQNQMSLNQEEQITIREEHTFTLGTREGQWKKKYDKLHEKYEELKQTLQKQRKQRQQELNDKDAQNQLIREKYFQLRSNEDTLTSDLKRLKQKLQSQNMIRTKYEQEVKELTFKINEMEDMLDGKENNLKRKSDQASHWKAYSEQLKGELKAYSAEIEKLQDRCQYLESQNKMIKKDIQNKENLIEQLRKNINRLIEENNIAKDQIYKLTIRSYQYEQENQIIKGDLIRRNRQQPQMNAIQENFMRSIESLSPKRRQNRPQKPDRVIEREERPERGQKEPQAQGNNRRRQFARQRAVTSKPQRQERPEREERREERKPNIQNHMERRQQIPIQRRTEPPVPRHNREAVARIQYLQSQLQKRKQQKAMNGKLRRQKIEMQRELEQLLAKMNQ